MIKFHKIGKQISLFQQLQKLVNSKCHFMDVHLRFDFHLVETTTFELLRLKERLVGCSLSRRQQLKVLCFAPHKKIKICYKRENSLLQSPWIICIAIMQRFAKKETSIDIVDKRNLHCLICQVEKILRIVDYFTMPSIL